MKINKYRNKYLKSKISIQPACCKVVMALVHKKICHFVAEKKNTIKLFL